MTIPFALSCLVTAIAFMLGLTVGSLVERWGHQQYCLCGHCKKWRAKARAEAESIIRDLKEPPQ